MNKSNEQHSPLAPPPLPDDKAITRSPQCLFPLKIHLTFIHVSLQNYCCNTTNNSIKNQHLLYSLCGSLICRKANVLVKDRGYKARRVSLRAIITDWLILWPHSF